MAKSKRARKVKSRVKVKRSWQGYLAAVLVIAGILFFFSFGVAHWINRQFLTTDNWVELVAPIPKDPEVSWILADYSVEKLFSGIEVEERVSEALPPAASFLAKPLTERVQSTAINFAQETIQSDRFQAVWITANREAHSRLMERARSDSQPEVAQKASSFALKLDSITSDIRAKFGSRSQGLFDGSRLQAATDRTVEVSADLKTTMDDFRRWVAVIDFANAIFGLAALACLFGALAFSTSRYRLLNIILLAIMVISLLQLIGVRVLRPEILNEIQRQEYRPAIAVVYDELTASFRRGATSIFLISAATLAVVNIVRSRTFSSNRFITRLRANIQATSMAIKISDLRGNIVPNRWPILGTGTLLVLLYLAFIADFDWIGVVQAALVLVIFAAILQLLASDKTVKK